MTENEIKKVQEDAAGRFASKGMKITEDYFRDGTELRKLLNGSKHIFQALRSILGETDADMISINVDKETDLISVKFGRHEYEAQRTERTTLRAWFLDAKEGEERLREIE